MRDITCPSGMMLKVRGLKGKELRLLEDKAAAKSGSTMDLVLGSCVEQVIDPGIYSFSDGKVQWEKVLLGDSLYVMLAIRIETFGDDFEFKAKCDACSHSYPWELNLSDVPIKFLGKEDGESVRNNIPIPLVVSTEDGPKVIKYRLANGADERALVRSKIGNKSDGVLMMLARRIVEIEGVTGINDFLENLGLREIVKLQKEMDEHDCGVETTIETKCPQCENVTAVQLPLGRDFWTPPKV